MRKCCKRSTDLQCEVRDAYGDRGPQMYVSRWSSYCCTVKCLRLSKSFPTDYAGWCGKQKGDSYPADDGFMKIVQHEPIGVCAAITAWNGSLHFFGFKVAPAVATGNTVIIKPSEKNPLSTLACCYLAESAGFPPGVIQAVTGSSYRSQFNYLMMLISIQVMASSAQSSAHI